MHVFSYCLYNPYNPFYYDRLIENIHIIHEYFPGWGIYVYIGNDVPTEFRERLANLGCILRDTNVSGALNMVHRFFAIDEPNVECMFVRDADSYVHWKDRWAIQHFLRSPYSAHTIRDNKEHCAKLMGGLWGMKKIPGISIRGLYSQYENSGHEFNGRNNDQRFLSEYVYPTLRKTLVIYYSHMEVLFPFENAVKFPFQWSKNTFCGQNWFD